MFSLITTLSLDHLGKHAEAAVNISSAIDHQGWIVLLVLGALAASGSGTDLINSLNHICGVNCGGGLMIGGALITAMVTAASNNSSKKRLPPDYRMDYNFNQEDNNYFGEY